MNNYFYIFLEIMGHYILIFLGIPMVKFNFLVFSNLTDYFKVQIVLSIGKFIII